MRTEGNSVSNLLLSPNLGKKYSRFIAEVIIKTVKVATIQT